MTARYLPFHENMDAEARRPSSDHHRQVPGPPGRYRVERPQRTADYPMDLNDGFQVMLDTEELVTVRWDQVEARSPAGLSGRQSD